MIDLAYLVSLGADEPHYLQCAAWAVDALRRWGRFEGDLVLVTDRAASEWPQAVRASARILEVDARQLVCRDHLRPERERYQVARLFLHRLVDLSGYRQVLYLDTDVLAVGDVRPLLDDGGVFRYAREYQPMSAPMFNAALTPAEREDARWRRGVNSGAFCAPARVLAHCLDRWREALDAFPHGESYDQAALNAVILRGQFAAKPWPAFAVGYPLFYDFAEHYRPAETRLLHYCGRLERKFDLMGRHYGDLAAGRPLHMPVPGFAPRTVLAGRKATRVAFRAAESGLSSCALINRAWKGELERRGYRVDLGAAVGADADVVVHHDFVVDFPQQRPVPGRRNVAVRNSDFGPHPPAWRDHVNRSFDQLWVHTEWTRDLAIEAGIDPDKVRLVPLGFDPAVFRPTGDDYPINGRGRFRFLFVGGVIPRKGIDILLTAYDLAFSRSDDVCLVIKDNTGNPFYRAARVSVDLRARMADTSRPKVVYLDAALGAGELAALNRACRVAVYPYRAEGFLLSALEALACGTPLVVPDAGPARAYADARTGFLVPAMRVKMPVDRTFRTALGHAYDVTAVDFLEVRPADLAAVLRRAFETPAERLDALGEAGALRAHGGFTWRHSVDAVEACLRELS